MSVTGTEAPTTLAGDTPRTLGTWSQLGLWGNLGISLLLPVAATYAVAQGQSLLSALLSVVFGAVLGSLLLGAAAATGAATGSPAMVLLRGLLGARLSGLPTVANLLQCLGWATFEIFLIAEVASRLSGGPRWAFVLVAGVLATAMAIRPLGVVKVLARYAVWLAIGSTVYLLVQVLRQPLPPLTEGGFGGFFTGVDLAIALPISWVPLAADYARHSRSPRAAFVGASVGYGAATIVFFTLGILALVATGSAGFDVIDTLLVLPAAFIAVLILVIDELDEAFANVYSTAVSAQNVAPRADRRYLAVGIGALATALALVVDGYSYEPFLFLIGSVFVPLTATFLVAFAMRARRSGTGWDVSGNAPSNLLMLLPWALGFVAYQLTAPTYFEGAFGWWTDFWSGAQSALGIPTGFSASIVALAVSGLLTVAVVRVTDR